VTSRGGVELAKSRGAVRRTTEERQREIAEATLKLVARHGVDGATIARISNAVGLTPGALYKHFCSREAVLAAAMDVMDRGSWISESSGRDVLDRLKNAAADHSSWAEAQFETLVHPMFQFAVAAGQGPVYDEMRSRFRLFLQASAELIDEGKRDGSIREDVDSRDIAWGLLMFAWAEDLARLAGLDEMITSGASVRVFQRLLDDITAERDTNHDAAE
jgi:AcrR family transcriptional regulator